VSFRSYGRRNVYADDCSRVTAKIGKEGIEPERFFEEIGLEHSIIAYAAAMPIEIAPSFATSHKPDAGQSALDNHAAPATIAVRISVDCGGSSSTGAASRAHTGSQPPAVRIFTVIPATNEDSVAGSEKSP
jgi:hypothetical protein